ncbi:class I SAM-dependent methyltransferase [Pseudoalteromonas sp. T1lg65]|uniref:class I SAM-dependent methyltransferase n=1 Tax=Pseudoalteromonas sp. T1lg65 TaxID=2077101 RepID=UPI003F7AF9E1
MRNKEFWSPSKFVHRNGKLRVNNDLKEVSLSSRLAADLVAAHYQQHLSSFATGKLLDLGCGKVPFYGAYSNFVSEVTCVDWGQSLHDNQYVDHLCDLNQPLPFQDQEFNTVLCSDVLEHLTNPESTLKEVARLLKPNGALIINTPFMYWLHEQPYDYFRYTRYALQRMAKQANLEVAVLEDVGGALEIMADVFSKFAIKIPVVGKILAWTVQTCALFLSRTSVGKKLMKKTSSTMPMGYFCVFVKRSS